MSYLNVNGWTIPIAQHNKVAVNVNESSGYSPNGVFQRGRSGVAGRWQFTTGLLAKRELDALEEILSHTGDTWRWPIASSLVVSEADNAFYSQMRRATTGTRGGTVVHGWGQDGSRVVGHDGENVTYLDNHSFGSVRGESSGTNILTDAEADIETSTPFAVVAGGGISASALYQWRGAKALEVICTSSGDGFVTNVATAITGGATYVATFHVKRVSGTGTITFNITDDQATSSTASFTLTDTDTWQRIRVVHTMHASATTATLGATCAATTTFAVDGLQLQTQQGGFESAWRLPSAGASVAQNMIYPQFMTTWNGGLTVAAWVNHWRVGEGGGEAPTHRIFQTVNIGTTALALGFTATAGLPFMLVHGRTGASAVLATASGAMGAGWHHVAGTYDPITETVKVYVDGVEVATASTFTLDVPDFELLDTDVDICGNTRGPGDMQALTFMPICVPEETIVGWASLTGSDPMPGTEPLSVNGSFLPQGHPGVQVVARIDDKVIEPHWHEPLEAATPGVSEWQDGGGRLLFTLQQSAVGVGAFR